MRFLNTSDITTLFLNGFSSGLLLGLPLWLLSFGMSKLLKLLKII